MSQVPPDLRERLERSAPFIPAIGDQLREVFGAKAKAISVPAEDIEIGDAQAFNRLWDRGLSADDLGISREPRIDMQEFNRIYEAEWERYQKARARAGRSPSLKVRGGSGK